MLTERILLCRNGQEISYWQQTGARNALTICSFLSTQTDLLHRILSYAWCLVGVKLIVGNGVHVAKQVWTVQLCARNALAETVLMCAHLMVTTAILKQVNVNSYLDMFILHELTVSCRPL